MIEKVNYLGRVIRTISHLRPIQVAYQFKNRVIKPKRLKTYLISHTDISILSFFDLPKKNPLLIVDDNVFKFNFLNIEVIFSKSIDWDFQKNGKLWNYNLQYVDFLKQNDLSEEIKFKIIRDLYGSLWIGKLRLEPYPASLRIMNVIRFLSKGHSNSDMTLTIEFLKAEVNYLSQNLEYHLMGNHLLENGFALLMGGYFFNEEKWIKKAEKLLMKELEEQILPDGAHFELSPMYHQIIFFRVLEACHYLDKKSLFYLKIKNQGSKMLSWLENISFKDGSIPHFNDSTFNIALSSDELKSIASQIGLISDKKLKLKESGYRKIEVNSLELIADVHGISPSYQPGHAHADTFSYCLNKGNIPIVVDQGISTYEITPRRDLERATTGHNTIAVNEKNSSEVWAGFRVGKRAKVDFLEEREGFFHLRHDGYKKMGIEIVRKFKKSKDEIEIYDEIIGQNPSCNFSYNLHFHPERQLRKISESEFVVDDTLKITFTGNFESIIENYQYCLGFNSLATAKRIHIRILNPHFFTKFAQIL